MKGFEYQLLELGAPRVGVTMFDYSYADIKMQPLKEGRNEITHFHPLWRRVSLVLPQLFLLSFLLLSIMFLQVWGDSCVQVTEDGASVCYTFDFSVL